jgi:hypothetical protein
MHDTSARLVEQVLLAASYRQWELTVAFPLRLRIARDPGELSHVLNLFHRAVRRHAIVAEALFARDGDAVPRIDPPPPSDEDVRSVLARLVRTLHRERTSGVEEPALGHSRSKKPEQALSAK